MAYYAARRLPVQLNELNGSRWQLHGADVRTSTDFLSPGTLRRLEEAREVLGTAVSHDRIRSFIQGLEEEVSQRNVSNDPPKREGAGRKKLRLRYKPHDPSVEQPIIKRSKPK